VNSPKTERLFETVFEDEDLLVVNKPAGLVCHPTKSDEYSSLIGRVRLHLGVGAHPQLVNRLDRETSGITVIAKSVAAARQLRRIWEQRQVQKEYLAIVHGQVGEAHGLIDAPLGKDLQSRVAIKDCVRPDGLAAQTEFWTETAAASFSLLRLFPRTGRKHQIRIHLAHLGYPIVGDKLYGSDEDLYLALVENRLTELRRRQLILPYQALHASSLRFRWREQEVSFRADPESWFTDFCKKMCSSSSLYG
jgi:23S rRNA pseudouridine1911/1915/1917 synthase